MRRSSTAWIGWDRKPRLNPFFPTIPLTSSGQATVRGRRSESSGRLIWAFGQPCHRGVGPIRTRCCPGWPASKRQGRGKAGPGQLEAKDGLWTRREWPPHTARPLSRQLGEVVQNQPDLGVNPLTITGHLTACYLTSPSPGLVIWKTRRHPFLENRRIMS